MQRLLTVIFVLIAAFTGSCGTELKSTPGSDLGLSAALAQLDQLRAPDGANPEQFAALKESLATALRSSGQSKFASAVPESAGGVVTDLVLTATGGFSLEWTYRNKGDYDQNKQVTISDLSALGANLGKNTSSPDWLTRALAADGDGNSEVNISDITPIGANLLATVTGYKLQTTDTPGTEGSWQDFDEVNFDTSSIPPGTALRRFSRQFAPSPNSWYRVVPVDGEARGAASNAVQYALAAPDIVSVAPLTGLAGEAKGFSAVNGGGTPTGWSWDFGGGAAPNTSAAAFPSVTLGAAGSYDASLTVSNAAGSDTFDFTLEVTSPVPPQIEDVQPQSGEVGTQLSLSATLGGGPVATYAWDFGGGAAPNTDTSAAPFVTLGAQGAYAASLTVSNAGGSDTFNFTLEVTAPVPPQIDDVQPQAEETGELVGFSATLSGGPVDTYAWDFGGGASPNTDATAAPSVTLGAVGFYPASLTVGNAGGSDTYEFLLTVTPFIDDPPQASFTATPQTGDPGEAVQLDASGSTDDGTITKYEWDLDGDGTYELDKGADPLASTTLPDPAGTLDIGLRVTDNALAQSETNRTLTSDQSAGWYVSTVHTTSYGMTGTPYLAEINGLPAVAFGEYTFNSSLFPTYAYSTSLDGSSGWHTVWVDDTPPDPASITLAEINGKPAMAFTSTAENLLRYAYSTQPDGHSVWKTLTVTNTDNTVAQLAEINGKPAIAYEDAVTRALMFARSSMSDGSSGWSFTTVDDVNWLGASLALIHDKPAIAYTAGPTPDLRTLHYAYSSASDGSSGWTTLAVDGTQNVDWTSITLRPVGGFPAVLWGNTQTSAIGFAHATTVDGSAGWSTLGTGLTAADAYPCPASLAVATYPTTSPYSALVSPAGQVKVGINDNPDGSGDWNDFTVDQAAAEGVTIASIHGHPAVAYRLNNGLPEIRYAVYR